MIYRAASIRIFHKRFHSRDDFSPTFVSDESNLIAKLILLMRFFLGNATDTEFVQDVGFVFVDSLLILSTLIER